MSSVSVTNTFTASTTAVASEVNANFSDLVNYINNRNSASATWDACSVLSTSTTVLVADNSTGTNDIVNFKDNGTSVFKIADGGAALIKGQVEITDNGTDSTIKPGSVRGTGNFDIYASGGSVGLRLGPTASTILTINANVVVGSAAIATNASDGFLYIPSCAGTPTGTPSTNTGRFPLVIDSTNHKLYFYDGSWRDVGP